MSDSRPPMAPIFSQVDVTCDSHTPTPYALGVEGTDLLREVLAAQDRTNELLEELVATMSAGQKQRAHELNQWKLANPELAAGCRAAAETLSQVQVEYLARMTDEISDTAEDLVEGEFMLHEFVDRYGPRLAHLNGALQVLSQLSTPSPSDSAPLE